MGLRAERDLWAEQQHSTLAERRVHDRRAALQIRLTPRPSAAQRRIALVPGHGGDTTRNGVRPEGKCGAVVEEHVHLMAEPVRERRHVVDADAQHRPGHVELAARQWLRRTVPTL